MCPEARRWPNVEGHVVLQSYDDEWPRSFEEEKGRLLHAAGRWIRAIEHVGSTAVPGLAAKPIIDMLLGLRSLEDAKECLPPLVDLGYEYLAEFEEVMPERRYLRRIGPLGYHLHMVELGSPFWERLMIFRDYLRSHPDVAHEYLLLKRELAGRYGKDREVYADAKTSFVRRMEERAREEASR